MNGKKARKLRHKAKRLAKGADYRVYQERGGTVELVPTCRRAIYQRLKKGNPK